MSKKLLTDVLPLRLTIDESDSGGKVVARGEFARADKPTANNRVYPLKIWESNIRQLQKDIKARKVFGECDHPESGRTSLKRVSHILTDLKINDDGLIIGEAEIVDTDDGKNLKALIKAGAAVGVSSRGYGSVVQQEGYDVVQEDFNLMTFDFVIDPAMSSAYPEFENPSLESVAATTDEVVVESAKPIKESAERDIEAMADHMAHMILASDIADGVERSGHDVSFSQTDLMDSVSDLVLSLDLSFSDMKERLIREEGLLDIAKMAAEMVTDEDIDDEDLAGEVAHKLMGSGGGSGDSAFDAVRKAISSRDAAVMGMAASTEVIDALNQKYGDEEEDEEEKEESTKQQDKPEVKEGAMDDVEKKETENISDEIKMPSPEELWAHEDLCIGKGLKEYPSEKFVSEEQVQKLESIIKQLSFALFLEKNLHNHPQKKEIIESLNFDDFEDLNQLNDKISHQIQESKAVKSKVLAERKELNSSIRVLSEEKIALSEEIGSLKEKVAALEKEKIYAESIAHTAALTAYTESQIAGNPAAHKIRAVAQKMKLTSKEQVDALIESQSTISTVFSDIRKSFKKDSVVEGKIPARLVEEAIQNSRPNDSQELSEFSDISLRADRFKILAGL